MSQAPLHKQGSRDKKQLQVSGDLEALWGNQDPINKGIVPLDAKVRLPWVPTLLKGHS